MYCPIFFLRPAQIIKDYRDLLLEIGKPIFHNSPYPFEIYPKIVVDKVFYEANRQCGLYS